MYTTTIFKTLLLVGIVFMQGCAADRFGSYKPDPKKATSRPYTIKGVKYHPQTHYEYDETGKASFYGDGDGFHGKKTSTGEVYDAHAMTAAHKTLPLPAVVEVTNLDNGKCVRLKVNDRGPFVKGRIIDVSTAAAKQLGFYRQGIANVRVRTLVTETKQVNSNKRYWQNAVYKPADAAVWDNPRHAAIRPQTPVTKRQKPSYMAYGYAKAPEGLRKPSQLTKGFTPNVGRAYYIQAGTFSSDSNALALKNKLRKDAPAAAVHIQRHPFKPLRRVKIGPFHSASQAQKQLTHLRKRGHQGFYVFQG